MGQHLPGLTLLHLAAVAQNHDPVGQLGHHGQVVADIDGRRVELPGDLLDGRQDLDLGGHVQGRGGFVEDDNVRAAGHGHGHHGPLELPPRDLMGVAVADLLRVGQEEAGIDLHGVFFGLGKVHQAVLDGRLGVLADKFVGRVEGGRGGLSHVGYPDPPDVPEVGRFLAGQLLTVEHYGSGGDPAALAGVGHGRQTQGRFAGPGFADQSQNLSPVQGHVDPFDDGPPFILAESFDPDIFHL